MPQFVDHLNQGFDVLRIHFRQNDVSQVENMAGSSFGRVEHVPRPLAQGGKIGKQYDRIEVPLHGAIVANALCKVSGSSSKPWLRRWNFQASAS